MHVLSLPLAFILSQDQTLHRILFVLIKSRLIIMRWFSIGSFQISRFHYSYSFALTSLLKRLSIQYVYERVFFLISLVFQSGCKSRKLISNWQMFFEVFFKKIFILFFSSYLPICQWTFRVLRGANVTSVFKSHKLFWIFFWKNFSFQNPYACQYFLERLSLLRVQK